MNMNCPICSTKFGTDGKRDRKGNLIFFPECIHVKIVRITKDYEFKNMPKVYIMSVNGNHAKHYANNNHLTDYVYLHSSYQLRGISNIIIIQLNEWYNNNHYSLDFTEVLMDRKKTANFNIIKEY